MRLKGAAPVLVAGWLLGTLGDGAGRRCRTSTTVVLDRRRRRRHRRPHALAVDSLQGRQGRGDGFGALRRSLAGDDAAPPAPGACRSGRLLVVAFRMVSLASIVAAAWSVPCAVAVRGALRRPASAASAPSRPTSSRASSSRMFIAFKHRDEPRAHPRRHGKQGEAAEDPDASAAAGGEQKQ
jgi:hypothetical protein